MAKVDFEQGMVLGMQLGGGDRSEGYRQEIIGDLISAGQSISTSASWSDIDACIANMVISMNGIPLTRKVSENLDGYINIINGRSVTSAATQVTLV